MPDQLRAEASVDGPHSRSIPARFVQSDAAPVCVLVGGLFRDNADGDGGPVQLLVAPGIWRELDPVFLPMLLFLRAPRTRIEATEWLAWAGAPADALDDLLNTGLAVQVATKTPAEAIRSFAGITVIPQSMPGDPVTDDPDLIRVRQTPDTADSYVIPIELERVLWGLREPADLPSAVAQLALETGADLDVIARRVLTTIPALLSRGLVRLEWLRAPGF
ncbi:hypothetical protein [Microbacterium sp. CJ88]|uniref:hypothetical protein n=1 Tax=Microbacterium sp. CJ88 TaxID=3445672 RepID=UPI003F6575FB